MRTILGVIFFAAIIGAGWYINDRQNKVLEFNDRIVELLTQTNNYFDGYVTHLDKYYAGNEIDAVQMRTELDKLGKNAGSAMVAARQITVPDRQECRMDYIDTHNPGTENNFLAIDKILEPFITGDDALFQEIVITQEEMAEKFDFELKLDD
ncbi:MAG: hypothetical protein HW411_1319 [Gammaproteobacteria bacterium]|nr:hypothetical protein [Gammaproteobacteria bacterium]